MFRSRKPRPPLTTFQRVDIELLLRKSIATIGLDAVRRSEIITDVSQLSLDISSPQALLESASAQVRERMNMLEVEFDLMVVDAAQLGYPSTYKAAAEEGCSTVISVANDTAVDPLRTVMELAYQYSYHFWRNRPNSTPLDTDPRTTHLLPLCFGLGVLASDACLYDTQWSQAGWSGWSISRSGYYNAVELGYALALLSRARGETKPLWSHGLRPDSQVTAQHAWRYFEQHQRTGGKLLFDSPKIPSSRCDMKELADWLRGEDLAFALAAGYALSHFDELPTLVIDAALSATYSGDKDLVPVAVRLLAGARHERSEIVDRVRQLIRSRSIQISLAAIQSANALGINLAEYRAKLSKLLDAVAEDSFDLLSVIGDQGHRLGFLEPQICTHIAIAIGELDDDLSVALVGCLSKIVDDPRRSIELRIKSPEIQQRAIDCLAKRP